MASPQEPQSASTVAPAPAPAEADEFAELLKQNFKPRSERAASEVESAVQTLVTQALADSTVVKGEVLDTIEEMIARLDEKLSAQMNEILHAPEFQQLESAWRGLNYLVFNSETDATLKIHVLNVGKMELYRNLKQYPGARWDQSPLFKKIYESEFGTLGGEPYGALIADYHFSHSPVDVQLLRDLGKIASASLAPLVTGADPNLLGMDSWRELMNPRDIGKLMDTPDYAAWKGLRDLVDSRFVALCMPRVLSRLPYGAKSEPVEEFAFEEETDGQRGEKYGWMNAAYVMATNINRAFKEYGWTVADPRRRVGRRSAQPADAHLPDRRRRSRAEVPDRDRDHRPARSRIVEGRPHFDRASQEHRQGRLHRRAVGLQAEADGQARGDRLGKSVGPHPLHVRGVALRPLPQVHGARQDRLDEGKGPARALAQQLDRALRRRRSDQLERRGQGAEARSRRPRSPSSRTRRTPATIRRACGCDRTFSWKGWISA